MNKVLAGEVRIGMALGGYMKVGRRHRTSEGFPSS